MGSMASKVRPWNRTPLAHVQAKKPPPALNVRPDAERRWYDLQVVSRVAWFAPCLLGLASINCSLLGYDSPASEDDAGAPDARIDEGDDAGEDAGTELDARTVADAGADALIELDANFTDGDASELDGSEDASAVDADASAPDADASAPDADAGDAETLDASDADASDASDAALDGALPPPTAVDAGTDTSEAGVSWDAGTATCSGVRALNLCWYLTPTSASCSSFCANHGGYDPRTLSAVGTAAQGGKAANCRAVISALGLSGTFQVGTRSDGRGFGCHQWQTGLWWLSSPAFSPTASAASARVACACAR
jgi:hypothetical protein